jgi:hypothetical protein
MNILNNIVLFILAFKVNFSEQFKFKTFYITTAFCIITINIDQNPLAWSINLTIQSEIASETCRFES